MKNEFKHANQFFRALNEKSKDIYVARMGEVVNFYPETQSADVMPYPKDENAMILNVPVCTLRTGDFLIYYPFKPGDKCVLLFMDNDTEDIKLGSDRIQTERKHNVTDCVCMGGFTLLNESLNIEDSGELCLQNISNTAAIVIKESGDIKIKGRISIEGFAEYNGRELARRGDPTTDGASIS